MDAFVGLTGLIVISLSIVILEKGKSNQGKYLLLLGVSLFVSGLVITYVKEKPKVVQIEEELKVQEESENKSDNDYEIRDNKKDDVEINSKKLSEKEYKELCIDLPWREVVKDRKTYVGTFLKKDLMVSMLGKDNRTGETVYICGEKKAENNYTGGVFTVYDRRAIKEPEIQLYDKIYAHGQIDGIYHTTTSMNPELHVKYIEFNGTFGEHNE